MTNPIAQFTQWLDDARSHGDISEPTAMTLATATAEGVPSARIVLLKEHDERGFVFYTNLQSRKGTELHDNPRATLVFYWMPLQRQVRIEGSVVQVSDEEADAYFQSREYLKKIGAWASLQSQPLEARSVLDTRVDQFQKQYHSENVPRPPHWSGLRVVPTRMEFWQQVNGRLHVRDSYTRTRDGWTHQLLYP